LGRLQREQQAGKAWLGIYLNCIIPIRFGVVGADKGATECRGFMSDQLTVFSSGVLSWCVKVNTLEKLYNNDLLFFS